MTDPVVKRSVTIRGHRTSVSLEAPFWEALRDIAAADGRSLAGLIAEIDEEAAGNLSSALRVYVLKRLQGR
ncbi:MAG: ribbon-helix-helix domain-containing protein [Rhodospirillaceae bacterium]|nr:ribbon-helix-helix domain-containing protein [Rhodospirillaceae bacterium]MYB15119.1 ribbon-helix-helix domain-containing protein [Rhodospirillaceae bacterium]MYG53750.1 ribbon-helix-helix domain-containing protein [Rhodospirillaceae bacterium]MYI51070.1 ribbon-helix-helix domain-containing protein [Rhodospirillaceae bacterium]